MLKPKHPTTTVYLRHYGDAVNEATRLRNEAVRQAHNEGMSLRAIADAVGMSHMGVKRIVDRQER